MVATNPQTTNEERARLACAPAEQAQEGAVQSLIDLGPALEQGLIDLKLESLPAGEQNPVPNSLHLPDWDPAAIGTAENIKGLFDQAGC